MMKKRVVCVVAALLLTTGVITAAAAELNKAGVDNSKQPETFPTEKMQRIMNQVRDMLGVCGYTLEELTNTLTYDGTNFFIGDVELHFGPTWYIKSAESAIDYDQDGELELVIDELFGLVNTTVTVEGHYQADGWMSVFTINDEVYREPGQPIWAAQHQWRYRNEYQNKQPEPEPEE